MDEPKPFTFSYPVLPGDRKIRCIILDTEGWWINEDGSRTQMTAEQIERETRLPRVSEQTLDGGK